MIFVKKITSLFIAVVMLLSFSVIVQAADEVTVTVGSVSGLVGDIVSVPVTVSEGSDLVSGAFCIEFDSERLSYQGYRNGDLSQLSQAYAQEVVVGTDAVGIIFSTENATISVADAGTVIYLEFEILPGEKGFLPLTVNLVRPDEVTVEGGIADTEAIIDATYVDGSVEVVTLTGDSTRISYSFSYDGTTFTQPVEATVKNESDSSKVFETAVYDFDYANKSVFIKYEINNEGFTVPYVEVHNNMGFWSVLLPEDGIVEIPLYILEQGTSVLLYFTSNAGTDSYADDVDVSFVIEAGDGIGSADFISNIIDSEYDTFVKANNGNKSYVNGYNTDVVYTEDVVGNLLNTKFWVSSSAPESYTYNYQSCELVNDEISGKAQYTDVVFEVYPENATVSLAGKTVVAEDGRAVFENIPVGIQTYSVYADGYLTETSDISVSSYMILPVTVSLQFNPYSTVIFNVTPDEAEVEFNGEIYLVIDGVTEFYDVPFGTYDYVITYPGYETYTGTVVVDSSTETVVVDLVEIVTSTDVVFNVTPANATVKLGTVTKTAVNGIATFTDVEFGSYSYTVSATEYDSESGTVNVEKGMAAVTVSLERQITSTNVTFNVTPADATVTLNGVSQVAADGVAVFEDVEFGTYTYSVAKEGYVTVTAEVTVAEGMAAVTVALEEEAVEPDTAPVPTLQGLRTYSLSYDEATQTITVTSINTNSTAGVLFGISGETDPKKFTTDSGNGISVNNSDASRYFVARKANGENQIFNIYYTSADGTKYTYVVNFSFIEDPSIVKFADIITLRVDKVNYYEDEKKIEADVDSNIVGTYNKGNFGIAIIPEDGAEVEFEYESDNGGEGSSTGWTTTRADLYTSFKTGVNCETTGGGAYGKQLLYMFKKSNGTRMYVNVKLTKGENTTTYRLVLRLTDVSYEGDVNVTGVLPLRADADSFKIDNEAKTIYYETTTENRTAGFAVSVDVQGASKYTERKRRQLTAVSGYNLAHGPITDTDTQNVYDRYVVARLSMGAEQTYKVKVHGGVDGRAYSIYTVTVKFNRVYEGDIEFTELLTAYADNYEFDSETNTINVYYSGDKVAIAPVLISGSKFTNLVGGSVTYIEGNKGVVVNVANGENQTVTFDLQVVNDVTTYTVNFIHQ